MKHHILIEKSIRRLTVTDGYGSVRLQCRISLGKCPLGHKTREGDGCTPEGDYYICLKRDNGRFGCGLGISYPSAKDAWTAVREGRMDGDLLPLFENAEKECKRPPWGTALGGEIYLHGGGTGTDWTAGCIALEDADMAILFGLCRTGDSVTIIP